MHFTLITASLNPGGSERAISALANHLATHNHCAQLHQISLITLSSSNSKPFYQLSPQINLTQLNQTQSQIQDQTIIKIFQISIIRRLKNIITRIVCLRKTIKNLKPDVIISFVDITNLTTLIAAINLNIPIIISERTNPKYHKLSIMHQILRKLFYPKAAGVVVQNESIANYFKNLHNMSIIPNAVSLPILTKVNINPLVQNIISVGRLCKSKEFDILIHSFANLIKTNPNLTLTIYGEGAERENLENLIRSLNLNNLKNLNNVNSNINIDSNQNLNSPINLKDKIFLPGAIQNIQEALVKADLFIFPSMYEGFPNALAEAMAVGLPVIASNCSGNTDLIEDHVNGRLFQIGNINQLSSIIEELINDPKQCEKLSLNAKKITEQYSEQRIYAMWDEVIKSCL